MKFKTRQQRRGSTSSGVIGRRGTIALPPNFGVFRLGQRVYFHVQDRRVLVTKYPKRSLNGRLPSSRIKRAVRSLETYGPRVNQ